MTDDPSAVPTQQSPTPQAMSGPLTEEQLLARFGPLMWDAYVAFMTDPGFFESICEHANSLDRRRVATAQSVQRRRARATAEDSDAEMPIHRA